MSLDTEKTLADEAYRELHFVERLDGVSPNLGELMKPFYNDPEKSDYEPFFKVDVEEISDNDPVYPGGIWVTYYNTKDGDVEFLFLVSPETGNVYLYDTRYEGDGNVAQMILGPYPGQVEE